MKIKTETIETLHLRGLLEGDEIATLSDSVLESYLSVMTETRTCKPLSACFDGTDYWVFDGYHRLAALQQLGISTCPVKVYKGGRRDAIRRYIADKLRSREPLPHTRIFRHCLRRLRTDQEWAAMTSGQLSSLFGRKPAFFDNLRLWRPDQRNDQFVFCRNKHGSVSLIKSRRS